MKPARLYTIFKHELELYCLRMVQSMKRFFGLAVSFVFLFSFAACSEQSQPLAEGIQFNAEDFVLRGRNTTDQNAAGHFILRLFDTYFTDADYGDAYFGENGKDLHLNLVKGSSQRENIARFVELAEAEFEKNGFSTIQTHEVDFSAQELKNQMNRLSETLKKEQVPFNSVSLDVQQNRIAVGFDDISPEYQRRVLRHIDKKYVIFVQEGDFQASIGKSAE